MPNPARVKAALLAAAGKSSEVLITQPVAREAVEILWEAYEAACTHAGRPPIDVPGTVEHTHEPTPSVADLEAWIEEHLPRDRDGNRRRPGPVTGELAPGRLAKFLAREGLTLDDVELTAITYPRKRWIRATYDASGIPKEVRPRSDDLARLDKTHSLVVYARVAP